MTHEKAMQILDSLKDGKCYSAHIVDEALKLTGDLND
jgi:hypothetical protein